MIHIIDTLHWNNNNTNIYIYTNTWCVYIHIYIYKRVFHEIWGFSIACLKVFPGAGDGTAAIWSSNGMRLCTLDWGGGFWAPNDENDEGGVYMVFVWCCRLKNVEKPCWKKQFGDFFSDRTAQCTVDSQNPLWESFFYKAVNGRQRVLKPTHMFLAHKFAIRKHLNCRINGIFLIEIKATISHYGDLSLDVKGYNNIGCIQRWRIHPRTFNNSVPSGKLTVGPWKSPIFNGN